jgi:CMP-N-acetylneuraminic acid synthetase
MSLVLGLVPARGGSKGVPGKNVRPLAGHTLLEYTARAARESGVIDRIVLSTDSAEIADAGRRAGLEVPFIRPASLAADDTPMVPVIMHALSEIERHAWSPDIIVLLQPTSPLRRPQHVRDAVNALRESTADSVVTVVEVPRHLSPDYVMRIGDGTVYAFRRSTLERFGGIYGDDCRPLLIDANESLSIDSPADWDAAERALAARM